MPAAPAAVPAVTEAAEAGWSWTAPHSRVRAAAAVVNAAGRLEDRFIVNLTVYAGVGAAGRLRLNAETAPGSGGRTDAPRGTRTGHRTRRATQLSVYVAALARSAYGFWVNDA